VEGEIEAVGVAELGDIGGGCALAEHLDDGVAGDEVDEEEDDGDHDPEDREGDEDAADGMVRSCQLSVSVVSCWVRLGAAGCGWVRLGAAGCGWVRLGRRTAYPRG
jgi:hypothetical protein